LTLVAAKTTNTSEVTTKKAPH